MNSNPTTDAHGVASHDLLCFATEAHGITSYVWTTTKGKAIAATVRQANDAGYRTMWVQVKCRRYAALDDYDLMDRKIRAHRCYSPDFIQHNSCVQVHSTVDNTGRLDGVEVMTGSMGWMFGDASGICKRLI